MFGLRDRFGAALVDPLGGIPVAFASREEAERHAREGDRVVDLTTGKIVPVSSDLGDPATDNEREKGS